MTLLADAIQLYPGLFRKDGGINGKGIQRIKESNLFKDIVAATTFLDETATPAERVYCVLHSSNNSCTVCGSKTKFITFKLGYRTTCSSKCAAALPDRSDKIRQSKLEKYGDENFNNIEQVKQTKLEKYGDENFNNVEQVKQTKLARHNDRFFTNREQAIRTNLERYRVTSYSKLAECKRQVADTCRDRYGVSNCGQLDSVKEKSRQTRLARYGDTTFNNREKTKRTKLERYNDAHYNNTTQAGQTNLEKYGVLHTSQKHIPDYVLAKLNDKDWLVNEHHVMQKTLSVIGAELGVDVTTVSNYLRKFEIQTIQYNFSIPEQALADSLRLAYNTRVITNVRTIIPPREIDIWIPEYRLAIEYNGVYWHRPEIYGGVEQWHIYHQSKIDACAEKGITLLHLWEGVGDHNELVAMAINGVVENNLPVIYEEIYKIQNMKTSLTSIEAL